MLKLHTFPKDLCHRWGNVIYCTEAFTPPHVYLGKIYIRFLT